MKCDPWHCENFETITPTQTININLVAELAACNGWDHATLFNFAKNYMLENSLLQSYYNFRLGKPQYCPPVPPGVQWTPDMSYPLAIEFFSHNNLMVPFYNYLESQVVIHPQG
jgi:hypothetical protein